MKKVTKKSTTHSPSSNGNENIETNINSNDWSSQSSAHLYQVEQWGEGYFQVDQKGQLCISPQKDPNGPLIPLVAVVEEARHASLEFPIVFRFHDILRQQVSNLNNTFIRIIGEAQYQGKYTGVYPIKVNQMREVVEEVLDVGDQFNYGLEAGSKAELLAVLALNKNPQSLTVLNGYKDTEYLKLAILGKKLERNVVVVIEKFSELVELNKLAKEEESIPLIGLRAKLGTRSTGKWSDSSGDFAKFGLTLPEMMKSIKFLKENNILSETKLFHFHVGSQIPDIRTIKECITEGARMYAQLYKMGVPLCYFDVGGGVGINYDGSKSPTQSSVNYSLQDYIGDIVYILKEICDLEGVPHPNIVSESGRLITAHHSCIITNVFGSINLFEQHLTNEELTHSKKHHLVKNMHLLLKDLSITNYLDTYNDAVVFKEESSNAFKLGVINLEDRATIEHLYWRICHQIIDIIRNLTQVPNELAQLESLMCDKYLCNFSVFQSAVDTWGINQILPTMPLTRLNEKPNRLCQIADITCDSDGKLDHFLSPDGPSRTLPLHQLIPDQPYYLGIFLTGAYQDIMGDMHNLFGRVNEVHVFYDEEEKDNFYIEEIIHGNKKSQVLQAVQYSPYQLSKVIKSDIDALVKQGKIKPRSGVKWADFYDASLFSYTYLQNADPLENKILPDERHFIFE